MIVQTVALNQVVANGASAYTPEILLNRSHTPSEVVFQIEGNQANTICSIEGKVRYDATFTTLTPTPAISTGIDGIFKVPICNSYRVKIDNTGELSVATMKIYMGN